MTYEVNFFTIDSIIKGYQVYKYVCQVSSAVAIHYFCDEGSGEEPFGKAEG